MVQSRKMLNSQVFDTTDDLLNSSSEDSASDGAKKGNKDPEERNRPAGTAAIASEGYGASWPLQYTTLFRRALKVRRFEALSLQDLAQCVCVAVLSGLPFHLKICFLSLHYF